MKLKGLDKILLMSANAKQASATSRVDAHVAGTAEKHAAEKVTYSGSVTGATDVKQGIDLLKARVDEIITTPISGEAAAQELVDARNGEDTLGDRLTGIDTQLADTVKQQFSTLARRQLYFRLKDIDKGHGKVTFVGDSVTELGWFTPLQTLFPNITFVNKGIGGNGTVDVINRLADITATNADLYVLAIGTNDVRYQNPAKGATTASEFATNIQTIITSLTALKTIVVSPFPAFDKDYTSVLGYFERDNLMYEYIIAEKEKCASLNVPFINVTDDLKSLLDFSNKQYFLQDYIHPNITLGIKLYSNVVLYGNQKIEDYGYTKTKAIGNHIYKYEIWELDNSVLLELKNITITTKDSSAVQESYTTCMASGLDDLSQIINTGNTTYHFSNNANDFPVIITFSTNSPVTSIVTESWTTARKIKNYKLYESQNPYAILDFNHESWIQKTNTEIFSPTYGINYSERGTNTYCEKVGNIVNINMSLKKTTAWAPNDVIAYSKYLPKKTITFMGMSHGDESGVCTLVPLLLEIDGGVAIWSRAVNTNSDTAISFSICFSPQ